YKKHLNTEVRKCFVRFGHTVCIFFLFESATFTFSCSYYLVRQLVCNGFTVALAAVTDQPFHAQRYFTVRTYFCRNLEGSTTYTAAAYFYSRGYINQCAFPYFVAIFTCHLGHFIYSIVKCLQHNTFVATPHQAVNKACYLFVVEFWIWC